MSHSTLENKWHVYLKIDGVLLNGGAGGGGWGAGVLCLGNSVSRRRSGVTCERKAGTGTTSVVGWRLCIFPTRKPDASVLGQPSPRTVKAKLQSHHCRVGNKPFCSETCLIGFWAGSWGITP